MRRSFIALMLALTLPFVVIAPVTSSAMSGDMLCEQRMAFTATETTNGGEDVHAAHGVGTMDHAGHAEPTGHSELTEATTPFCCEDACIAEVSVLNMHAAQIRTTSVIPRSWSFAGLNELSQPTGLRRPPKA
ncbi:hypothetical protein RB2654_09584 [Rhodobacterales bacterium HTCC2654]|uniref:Uncharacterized protein n=2 Tax=Maritimibacter TaxID=404235 RepID=A3VEH3_9RHOB|nr:hypothetical protein RB2654_09584 [Rhodobacterales bacterium HTCC2654] [Maritimibacter alkaliphilus HTCC2654]